MSASIRITLEDGSNCYVTVVPVASFRARDVCRAVGEAAAWFIEGFARNECERGGVPWNPEAWLAEMEERRKEMRWRD